MRLPQTYRIVRNVVVAALLAGCTTPYSSPTPYSVTATVTPQSAQSLALSRYYVDLQQQMRSRGLLMQDDGTASASVTPYVLARNFEAIALFNEYRPVPAGFVHQSVPSQLRRWEDPVRMSVEFGNSVPISARQTDNRFIATYAQKLSQVTNQPIAITNQRPNYLVMIVGQDDTASTVQRIKTFIPGISDLAIDAIANMPPLRFCMVLATGKTPSSPAYGKAVAVIRAELPDLLRQSCVSEELAQGLGLANDSPHARQSIFNDVEEFTYLTRHDELLLKILYDPRLSVGMTADQARPVVQQIAAELAE